MKKKFWKNKRVLITGNTGFKGSWITLWLKSMGAELLGYSNEIFENNIHFFNSTCETIIGDIRDYELLNSTVQEFKPEVIIHLAAQPLVRESYENPKQTYEINVIGSLNVYEATLKLKEKCFVISATTDKVYLNKEQEWGYRENDILCGQDPYSNSKSCAELLSYSYNKSFFKNSIHKLITVRAGNVIGGGDWSKDRLIPDIIKNSYNDKNIVLRNPNSTRPWQFVLEPLYGYLSIVEKYWETDCIIPNFNFGPNYEQCLSVKEISDYLTNYLGNSNIIKVDKSGEYLHESNLLFLDCTKAKSNLGWFPVYETNDALIETAKWYVKYFENEDIVEFSIKQIKDFEKRAGIR